jgi:hypothetical protein
MVLCAYEALVPFFFMLSLLKGYSFRFSIGESRTPCHPFAGVRRRSPSQKYSEDGRLFRSPEVVEVRRRGGQEWGQANQAFLFFPGNCLRSRSV